jgi:hypothetical protein
MEEPPKTGHRYCRNCYYPLPKRAGYCPNCGQKYSLGKLTVRELLDEFFDAILNVDSKVFRTIAALFCPGKLTNAYFQGKHKRYVHPLRIFLVTAVLHFAVLGYVLYDGIQDEFRSDTEEYFKKGATAELRNKLFETREEVKADFKNNRRVNAALDSLLKVVPDFRTDSVGYPYFIITDDWQIDNKTVKFSQVDLVTIELDSLMRAYEIRNIWSQTQIRQGIRINQEGGNFAQFVLGKLIWMVALMMPALALVLKLLYIRRNRYYVEHLVFSFHYHAFAFLVFSVGLLGTVGLSRMGKDSGIEGLPVTIAVLGIIFYLYKAMRKVYKQGRIKTFLKYNFLNFTYLFIFIFFASLTFVVSAFLF